jgi:hypothetical protein
MTKRRKAKENREFKERVYIRKKTTCIHGPTQGSEPLIFMQEFP